MNAQERYLAALNELELAREQANEEEARMRFKAHGRNEYRAGKSHGDYEGAQRTKRDLTNPLRMAIIHGVHRGFVDHILRDDGGRQARDVIHHLNNTVRKWLEQATATAGVDNLIHPGMVSFKVTFPAITLTLILSPAQMQAEGPKTNEMASKIVEHIINQYNSPPSPRPLTEREEYEAYAKAKRERSMLDRFYDSGRD